MAAVDEIPISTLVDNTGFIELGLVAADVVATTSMGLFGGIGMLTDALADCRTQCRANLRQEAIALGGTSIRGVAMSISISSYHDSAFVVAVHGTGTAVRGAEDGG